MVLDFGGVRDGYCADPTCTVCVGPADAKARHVCEAVLMALAAAMAAVRPGAKTPAVDRAARRVPDGDGAGAVCDSKSTWW